MHTQVACPSAESLRLLLLGRDNGELTVALERHLTDCPTCAERAGGLATDDELVAAVRRASRPDDTPPPPLTEPLRSVFRRMRASPDPAATFTWPGSAGELPAADRPDALGRIGPYRIDARLGAGGMGVVYRGFDPRLERAVAVKVIRPDLLAARGIADRFVAEARMAAAVEHDHIVAVFAVEEHDGVPCLVMPLLKGRTLDARLKEADGPLPVAEVRRLADEITAGLAAAHACGLVHRDVKPANIWLEAPGGRVKLLDFGLAVSDPTAVGFAGTPGYMAPEQVRGEPVSPRTDLFALGCVLYRAAVGCAPFHADEPSGSLVKTLTRDPLPTRIANPTVPQSLADLIDRLLVKDPAGRPESADAVAAELTAMGAAEAAARRRTTRRRWLLGVATAAVGGGVGAWLLAPVAAKPLPPVRVAIAADPDAGPLILSHDGTDLRFDPATEAALLLVPGDYRVRSVASEDDRVLVPDGFHVLPDAPRTVKLARVGQAAVSKAHDGPVSGVAAVGPAVLSAGLDRTLSRWTPGQPRPDTVRLSAPARCLAVSADGNTIATAGGDRTDRPTIELWNGHTLAGMGEPLAGHTRVVWAVALAPNGSRLLSAARGETWLWELPAGTKRELDGHGDVLPTAAAFDPAGKLALTADEDGRVILWDTATAQPLKKLIHPTGVVSAVRAVAFVPDGFVTAGDDRVVRVWDYDFRSRAWPAVEQSIRAVAADGRRVLTGGADGRLTLWTADGGARHTFAGHTAAVTGVAFTPDGRGAVSAGADRTVRLWRLPFD